jgi:hypothetical protein
MNRDEGFVRVMHALERNSAQNLAGVFLSPNQLHGEGRKLSLTDDVMAQLVQIQCSFQLRKSIIKITLYSVQADQELAIFVGRDITLVCP